jgi:hypothetical protein
MAPHPYKPFASLNEQDRSEASFDFWCLVAGVSAVFGVWSVGGVWCLVCRRCLVSGVSAMFGVWCLVCWRCLLSGGVLPLMKPPFWGVLSHAKFGSVVLWEGADDPPVWAVAKTGGKLLVGGTAAEPEKFPLRPVSVNQLKSSAACSLVSSADLNTSLVSLRRKLLALEPFKLQIRALAFWKQETKIESMI